MTATGAVMGTPAYMAPEQHAGGAVDERSDQYSFCVALYEALYGEHPFTGEALEARRASMLADAVRPPPRGAAVPGWLRAAVLRGLRARPEDRWPSMAALLDALARDPAERRRRGPRAAGAAALLGLAIAGGIYLRREAGPSCDGGRARIGEVWGAPARAAVRVAILGAGRGHAGETWARVEAGLDRYAAAWAAMHTEACLAHRRGEQSDALLDLRMSCLERRRVELRALVDVLGEPGRPAVVDRSIQAVHGLEPLDGCADAGRLRAPIEPPRDAAAAAKVAALRDRLAAGKADYLAGLYDRGLATAGVIAAEAHASGYGPIIAEALFRRGSFEVRTGRFDAAAASFEDAYTGALAARADELAADAAIELMIVLGHRQGKPDAARPWERTADALATRIGARGPRQADFLNARGILRTERGQHAEAADDHRRALAIYEATLGPRDLAVGQQLHNLGRTLLDRGRNDEALAALERAISIGEERLGPDHPEIAEALDVAALALLELGRYGDAVARLRRALALKERALPPDSPDLAGTLVNLGMALDAEGSRDEAAQRYARALAIFEAETPPNRVRIAQALTNLGALRTAQGKPAEAAANLGRALSLKAEVLGSDHPALTPTLISLGDARAALGEIDEARAAYRRALAITEAKLAPDHPRAAGALVGLGRIALFTDAAAAIPLLERALAIHGAGPEANPERADVRFLLARALDGRDRARALSLAAEAAAEYAAAGAGFEARAAAVAAWRAGR
ncbi:MAG: tetratricopeptide repeat-containing protein kinase family protein [Minicystis sp.]